MMHKRIIIVGKAGSGKDYLKSIFAKKGYKPEVSCTTRPPRTGEIDGESYIFLTEEQFDELEQRESFYELARFNGWRYGTLNADFYSNEVFIMTPSGIAQIKPEDRRSSFVIYLDIPLEIRKARLMKRSDVDKVERRLKADEEDFAGFSDYDVRIDTPNF